MRKIIFTGCFILFALPALTSSSEYSSRSPYVNARCVARHEAAVAYAYESLFKTRAIWPKVKASVEFAITAEGSVEDVRILRTEGFDTTSQGLVRSGILADKITEAAYTWRFPPVRAGVTTVEMPFFFVPVEGEEKEIAESTKTFKEIWDYGERVERDGKTVYVLEEFVIECRRERAVPFEVARARPEGDVFATAARDKHLDGEAEKQTRDYLKEVASFLDELSKGPASKLRKKLASRERGLREVEAALAEEESRLAVADLGLAKDYNWRIKKANAKKVAKLRENQARLTAETETLREEVSTAENTWARLLAEKWVALITRGEELLSTRTLAEKWAAIITGGEELLSTRTPEGNKPWLVFALAELNLDAGEGTKAAQLFEKTSGTVISGAEAEALYGLAHAHLAAADEEKAAQTFLQLTTEHPDSPHAAEAYFRLGDYFATQREPLKAEKYFLLASQADAEYGDAALYRAPWGYYECTNPFGTTYYDRAVPAFKRFLDAAEEDSGYWDHAIEMTALSLAEWEPGTAERPAPLGALSHYEEVFGGADEGRYSVYVLRALGDAYLYKMDRLPEAEATYEYLLEKYPSYEHAPAVTKSLVETHLRREGYDDAHDVRLRVVDEYGPASSWYRAQDDLSRCMAIITWENALYEVGVYFNMQAERKRRLKPEGAPALYESAINRYNQYLTSFPTNEKAYHINFYLAESYFAVEDYENAAEQYIKTAVHYTDRERYNLDKWDERFTQEQSLYNAVVSYDEIFQKEVDEKEIAGVAPTPPSRITGRPLTEAEANVVETCAEFIARYPESKEVPTILSKAGEVYFQGRDYERAREYYVRLVDEYPEPVEERYKKDHDSLYVHALILIATTYSKEAEVLVEAGNVNAADEKRAEYQAWYERAKAEAESRKVDFEKLTVLTRER